MPGRARAAAAHQRHRAAPPGPPPDRHGRRGRPPPGPPAPGRRGRRRRGPPGPPGPPGRAAAADRTGRHAARARPRTARTRAAGPPRRRRAAWPAWPRAARARTAGTPVRRAAPGPAGQAAGARPGGWQAGRRRTAGADPMPVEVELNGLLPGAAWPRRGRLGRRCRRAGTRGAGRGTAAAAPPGGRRASAELAAGSGGSGAAPAVRGGHLRSPALVRSLTGHGHGALAGAGRWPGRRGRPAGWPAAAAAGERPAAVGAAGAADRGRGRGRGRWPRRLLGGRAPPAAADGAACALRLGCWPANASLSLRTTGASIVEDAERTNSPISSSLAITALLSTPNSLASSYTRTFATTLPLLGPDYPGQSAGPGQRVLRPASASAVHRRMLIGRSLQSQPALCGTYCGACPDLQSS